MIKYRKIGQILVENGVLTKEQLEPSLTEQHRKIGQILAEKGVLTKEHIDAALVIQKKEGGHLKKRVAVLISVLILSCILFVVNLNNQLGIVIQEAKITTGVDEQLLPIKITNSFPKNTAKVCAWINWRNAKINTQILVKWHYVTDDIPIYNYTLNIPKREGVANVTLTLPEGKHLPDGLYKVDILSGKKHLTKTLTFEIG
ncbi:MAG: hypothetical protein PHR84_04565 [Candidatus Omnitrophica bacterium]|nr:hypothetical protein [Candidatus Omnitrophota bacterium]